MRTARGRVETRKSVLQVGRASPSAFRRLAITLSFLAMLVAAGPPRQAEAEAVPPAECAPAPAAGIAAGAVERPYLRVDYRFPSSSVTNPTIYVLKSRRRLLVVEGETLIRSYPIGLGTAPLGDKEKRGDCRTPEGTFYICGRNPGSRYYKALDLTYPSLRHAEKALLSGTLSELQYQSIAEAIRSGQRPPSDTYLGGDICIHGGGAQEDWTRGCVAMYDRDMDELFEMICVGTTVIIYP
ncbi:MAG: L,D-transpeptidase family protein [bacterium]